MANEAVLVQWKDYPIDFGVANGTGIEKGTLMKLSSPRACIISSGANDPIAGIARREKIASDGRRNLSIFQKGTFKMKLSGAAGIGAALASAATGTYPNYVQAAGPTISSSKILGHALVAGTNGDTIEVELNIGVGPQIS